MEKPQKVTQKKDKFEIFSLLALFSTLGLLIFFINAKVDHLLDSDMSSELLLGKILASENKIISENWYYSTELRVLNAQILYAFFFKLTSNWHVVRVSSYIVMYIAMVIVYRFYCTASNCKPYWAITAILLFVPFSGEYFFFALLGCYYLPYILITLITLSIRELYIKATPKVKVTLSLAVFFLSVIVGMAGPRQLMILHLPLLFASLIELIVETCDIPQKEIMSVSVKSIWNRNKSLQYSSIVFLGAIIGYVINVKILAKIFHFESWNNIFFTELDLTRFTQVFNGFLNSFGYSNGTIFSIALLKNLMCLGWILLTFAAIVYAIRERKELLICSCGGSFYRLALFIVCAYGIYILLYVFTDMSHADRYNLPIIILSVPLISAFFRCINIKEILKKTILVVFVIGVCTVSIYTYNNNYNADRTKELRSISKILIHNGYLDGYATFWNANVLTELSNGEIEMWSWRPDIQDVTNDVDDIFKWLQPVKHEYTHPDGKLFLLFSQDEFRESNWKNNLNHGSLLYDSEAYTVVGYDNYKELLNDTSHYTFSFDNNLWIINGKDIDSHREIYADGISYGPYLTLPPGTYQVLITGENLRNANVTCTSDAGKDHIDFDVKQWTDSRISYTFYLSEKTQNIETCVQNTADNTVILNSMEIMRMQ